MGRGGRFGANVRAEPPGRGYLCSGLGPAPLSPHNGPVHRPGQARVTRCCSAGECPSGSWFRASRFTEMGKKTVFEVALLLFSRRQTLFPSKHEGPFRGSRLEDSCFHDSVFTRCYHLRSLDWSFFLLQDQLFLRTSVFRANFTVSFEKLLC